MRILCDLQLPKASRDLAEYKADFNKLINVFLMELESLSKTDMNVKKLYLRLNFNGFYKSKDPEEEEEEEVVNESDEDGDKEMKDVDSYSSNSGEANEEKDNNTAKGVPKTMGVLDYDDDDDDF